MVPISFILARSQTAAVKIQHLTAYPTGFEFQLVAHYRPGDDMWDPMHGIHGVRGRPGGRYDPLADEILRFGIQFADGSKATNLGPPVDGPDDEARGPFLQAGSGSGGGAMADTTYWVWPLPPAGPLTFVCEWPSYDIPLTRHEIDANPIRDAAKRAVKLWPEESAGPGGAGWSAYGPFHAAPTQLRDRGPHRGKRPRRKA